MSLHDICKSEAPDGAAAGTSPAVADAEAAANQSQSITAHSNHSAKSRRALSNRKSRVASVALQQKSKDDGLVLAPAGMFATVDYAAHSDDELHNATLAALAAYKEKREEADNYAYDVLIPALNQIIHRYKQQGRAASYRLNGCPTVEEYFESIGLNYSTVRSWKSRAQQRLLQAAPIPQKRPEWLPLEPSKKYTARQHPQGGWGVYEAGGSTVCWQKYPRQDEAWDAIESVNLAPLSAVQSQMTVMPKTFKIVSTCDGIPRLVGLVESSSRRSLPA